MVSVLRSLGSIAALSLLCGALASQTALAQTQTLVVPTALTNTEGNGNYGFNTLTAQQLISSSLLTSLPVGSTITGLAFRLNGGQATNAATTFTNFDVRLGGSNVTALASGQSFAANEAADTVLARSGSLTFATGAFPGGSTPNAFGPVITFTTPYIYTGGNLLFTFSSSLASGSTLLTDDDGSSASAGNDYMQGSGYNATTSFARSNGFSVLPQFTFTPGTGGTAAPEPGSIALLALAGLPAVGMIARQRRKTA